MRISVSFLGGSCFLLLSIVAFRCVKLSSPLKFAVSSSSSMSSVVSIEKSFWNINICETVVFWVCPECRQLPKTVKRLEQQLMPYVSENESYAYA
jgi:hypothetical protein